MPSAYFQPAIRITFITAVITALLAVLKCSFGLWGQSHALIADGVHSFSDVLIDILVLFATHFSGKKADQNHPYGHGRIETAATFGLALLLAFTGVGIILDAGKHLWGVEIAVKPTFYVLWIAILAIVINEILFRYTLNIAKKIQSSLLEANAWHSRSDVAVSIVVLLSIGGALLGFTYLDAIGAAIVGIMIIKLGLTLAWRSISELIDTGVDEKTLTTIQAVIKNVSGIHTLHMLRTRTINNKILLDVHIIVEPYISVSEGHYIGEQVISTLYQEIKELSDVTLHVDPEDDEIYHASTTLPDRDTLIQQVTACWEHLPGVTQIKEFRLHYLGGKIEIEIYLPMSFMVQHHGTIDQLSTEYQKAIRHYTFIQRVKLWIG
jgi:cation diffusion facilitator family transporter